MVVRLHLEGDGEPVADVDDARVLAGPLEHARPRRRERPEVDARGLVGAVLAPHRREDAELDVVRLAAEDLQDSPVLVGGEVVLGDELGSDRHGRGRVYGPEEYTARSAVIS